MSESAEMMYVGLSWFALFWGRSGMGHYLHFDETMEIMIGYVVLQIVSI